MLPEFPEENEVPHRLAGEEVVSWKKDSMIGNCKRCSTVLFITDVVAHFSTAICSIF